MYRNKMMIIATVLVSGLLGVMIWSCRRPSCTTKSTSGRTAGKY